MIIPAQDYVFVADEAGISNDRFTVVGGLCMRARVMESTYATLKRFRRDHNMHAELKWTKVSDQKINEYQALMELFFALNNVNHIQFHCIVFDSHQWNHHKYNQGDGDIGLSKLYYQLILHRFVKTCGKRGSLYVRVDHRNSSTSLESVRKMLNAAAARDFGIASKPIKQFVSEDSKNCDLLQLNDVILGSVCAARNGRHMLEGMRRSKRWLAEIVLEKSGLKTFDQDTPVGQNRFTVWNMQGRPR